MTFANSPPLTDPADVRFRLATVKTGCWLTFAVGTFILLYAGQTWHAGNRPAVVAIIVAAFLFSTLLLTVVPLEAIVAGRWRETFFLAWSMLLILMLVTLGLLDRLQPSPVMLPMFMPLIFAELAYPIRSSAVVAVLTIGGFVLVSIVRHGSLAYDGLMLSCLVWTACMGLWQARNREHQRSMLDRHREDLAHTSRIDPLTGALNRRGFEERLESELAEAGRAQRPLTLVTLDLDDFKSVNDHGGHAAGDALLILTVQRISAALRPGDAIGRLGGDEFAVILPGAGTLAARPLVARLQDALDGEVPASLGRSCFPEEGLTADELLRHADVELYAVKRTRPHRARAGLAAVSGLPGG